MRNCIPLSQSRRSTSRAGALIIVSSKSRMPFRWHSVLPRARWRRHCQGLSLVTRSIRQQSSAPFLHGGREHQLHVGIQRYTGRWNMGGWPDDCRCAEQPSGADDEHNLLLNPLLSNALVNAVIMIQDVEGPRDGE